MKYLEKVLSWAQKSSPNNKNLSYVATSDKFLNTKAFEFSYLDLEQDPK